MFSLLVDQHGVIDAQRIVSGQSKGLQACRTLLTKEMVRIGKMEMRGIFTYNEIKAIARSIPTFDMVKFQAVFDRLRDDGTLLMNGSAHNEFRFTTLEDL
eukprot:UN03709